MGKFSTASFNNPRNKLHIITPGKGRAICGRKGKLYSDKWHDSHDEAWRWIYSNFGCLDCINISKQDAERLVDIFDNI